MAADVVKIKSKDTVVELKKLLQEVTRKREFDLKEHQEDQNRNFMGWQRTADDLEDANSRNSKLWSLLIISTTLNFIGVIVVTLSLLKVC